jgi:plastocyanin
MSRALLFGILSLLAAAGCDSNGNTPLPDMTPAGPCGSAGNPIVASGHTFSPTDCQVKAGDTVNWTWGTGSHSITSDPGAAATFDSGLLTAATFQFTVPAATASGTVIKYHCQNHGDVSSGTCMGMCATLTVK